MTDSSKSQAKPSIVGLVPARAGSKRVKDKNIMRLAGHPLIAYTIAAARASGVFDAVVVSTDSEAYAAIARHYGAEVPSLRPENLAGDTSPDIDWIRHSLAELASGDRTFDCFAILRPTSPCRKAATIVRAWRQFLGQPGIDSLRAVELCAQHPGKMWVVRGERMHPLIPMTPDGATPYHSTQYAGLPKVYVQNASLEIAWSQIPIQGGTIAGEVMTPFLTEGDEGFDVNSQYDWRLLEAMTLDGSATLPAVEFEPYTN